MASRLNRLMAMLLLLASASGLSGFGPLAAWADTPANTGPANTGMVQAVSPAPVHPEADTNPAAVVPHGLSDQWLQAPVLQGHLSVSKQFPDAAWWQQFNDPQLSAYVEQALQANPDIKQAFYKVQEAKGLVKQAIAKELPTLNLNPQYVRIMPPNVDAGGNGLGSLLNGQPLNLFLFPLQASYELDLFGKNWQQVKATRQDVEAAKQDWRNVQISLVTEVGSSYFNLLRVDRMIALQEEAIGYQKDIAALRHSQYDNGLTAYDDVLQAERNLAGSEHNLADLRNQRVLFANALSALIGQPPRQPEDLPRGTLAQVRLDAPVNAGVPAGLIVRRPDILAREAQLKRANIEISAARRAFFPTINLGGQFAYGALDLTKLFQWSNHVSVLTAGMSQSLFAGGARIAELNIRKTKAQEAVEAYRKTILEALRDVENALSTLNRDTEQFATIQQQVALTEDTLQLSRSRMASGLSPELEAVQVQSQLTGFQMSQAQDQTTLLIDRLSLYKALGGGY